MASFNVVNLDGVMDEITRRTTKAVAKIPKMLEVGAAVLVEAQKQEVDYMIQNGLYHSKKQPTRAYSARSLGDLKKSIKATKLKEEKGEQFVEIYPHGVDSDGTRNADKGFSIEYGRSNTNNYAWMTAANEKSKDAVNEAMQKVWQEDDE